MTRSFWVGIALFVFATVYLVVNLIREGLPLTHQGVLGIALYVVIVILLSIGMLALLTKERQASR